MGIWAEAKEKVNLQMEKKALAKTPGLAPFVHITAVNKKQRDEFLGRGWEVVAQEQIMFGGGNHWLMRIPRGELVTRLS